MQLLMPLSQSCQRKTDVTVHLRMLTDHLFYLKQNRRGKWITTCEGRSIHRHQPIHLEAALGPPATLVSGTHSPHGDLDYCRH